MHVLITRREALNEQTAQLLSARGHIPVSIPLAQTIDTATEFTDREYGGILFTSQAAIEVLGKRPTQLKRLVRQNCPVYCVGDETAEQAISVGFTAVHSAGGNSGDLSHLVVSKFRKSAGPLLYLAGVSRSGSLDQKLIQSGFTVNLVEIYDSTLLDPGKIALESALQAASKGCGLLYSTRSAIHLFNLCETHSLSKCLNLCGFVAISTNVAKAVEPLTTQPILVAQTPSQRAMLDSVELFQQS